MLQESVRDHRHERMAVKALPGPALEVGDVMKESAQAALTLVKSRAASMSLRLRAGSMTVEAAIG